MPDINTIITSANYSDGWDILESKWQIQKNAEVSNQKYIYDKMLTHNRPENEHQLVYLKEDSHLIHSTIASIQVTLGDAFNYDGDNSTAIGTTIQGEAGQQTGSMLMYYGTKAYDTTINSGGSLILNFKAKAYNTRVNQGGTLTISSGSATSDGGYAQANIINGGEMRMMVPTDPISKATSSDNLIINGGKQYILGGIATNNHIASNSYQLASGLAKNNFIYDTGYQLVYRWDDIGAQNTTVYTGSTQRIQVGIADQTTIYNVVTKSHHFKMAIGRMGCGLLKAAVTGKGSR